MLELAVNHLTLANSELSKVIELVPDPDIIARVSSIKNELRRLMVDLESQE